MKRIGPFASLRRPFKRRRNLLRIAERRLEKEKKRAERPITGRSSKARYLSRKATTFRTYEDFPLEAEKAALLKSLK